MTAFEKVVPIDIGVRTRAIEATNRSVALEAGAGAGKTSVLVDRVLAVLESGTAPGRIAVITFTEKAAGEIAERVRDRIEVRLADAKGMARHVLERAVANLPDMATSTIHGFARTLLEREAFEASWAPRTELLASSLLTSAVDVAYAEWRRGFDARHPEEARRIGDRAAPSTLKAGAMKLLENRDLEPVVGDVPWAKARDELRTLHAALVEAAAACGNPAGCTLLKKNGPCIEQLAAALALEDPQASVEAALAVKGWNLRGGKAADWLDGSKDVFTDAVKAVRDDWCKRVERERYAPLHRTVIRDLVEHFLPAVDREKQSRGQAQFDDLLFRARALLSDNADARRRLALRYDALLIDEVQDTDPVQAEIALLLTRDPDAEGAWSEHPPRPGRLFAVGDAKQSIYGFRRADVATWRSIEAAIAKDGEKLRLSQNFRSVPGIVAFANHAFSTLADYTPVVAHRGPAALDAVVVVRTTREEEHEAAVRHVHELLESKAEVWDRSAGLRPIRASDVMVVLPAWSKANLLLDTFGAAGISAVVEGGSSFFERDEVRLALAALKLFEEPGDAEAVVFVLRGVFGLSHEDLARHVANGGLWRYTREDQPPGPVADALATLRTIRLERRRRSLVALLDALLDRTRAAAVWSLTARGVSALANLDKVRELVRQLEGVVETSAEVIAGLERMALAKADDLPVVDPDVDAVRITTLFGAKGREAPVVVLVHADRRAGDATAIVDREARAVAITMRDLKPPGYNEIEARFRIEEQEERRRWMYVAATRARDQLVICYTEKSKLLDADLAAAVDGAEDVEHDGLHRIADGVEVRIRDGGRLSRPPSSVETFPGRDEVIDRLLTDPPEQGDGDEHEWLATQRREVKSAERASVRWRSVSQDVKPVRATHSAGLGQLAGRVVHRVMEHLDLSLDAETLEALVPGMTAVQAHIVGLPDSDQEVVQEIVRGLLASDVVRRARTAPERWQEAEFSYTDRGRIIAGTIDLCFPTDTTRRSWVVVDYKSDVPPRGSPEHAAYEQQIAHYARALIANLVDHDVEIVERHIVGPHPSIGVDARARALQEVEPSMAPALEALLDAGAPVPDVGMDVGADEIIGQLELSWEDQKLGLLVDPDDAERRGIAAEGYTIVSADTSASDWITVAFDELASHLGIVR